VLWVQTKRTSNGRQKLAPAHGLVLVPLEALELASGRLVSRVVTRTAATLDPSLFLALGAAVHAGTAGGLRVDHTIVVGRVLASFAPAPLLVEAALSLAAGDASIPIVRDLVPTSTGKHLSASAGTWPLVRRDHAAPQVEHIFIVSKVRVWVYLQYPGPCANAPEESPDRT